MPEIFGLLVAIHVEDLLLEPRFKFLLLHLLIPVILEICVYRVRIRRLRARIFESRVKIHQLEHKTYASRVRIAL